MSTVAFLNIGMHGRVNPTLPIVAELVRRGHTVSYHTSAAFGDEIAAAGAKVHLYPGGDLAIPDPPTPAGLVAALAGMAVRVLPSVLSDLRSVRPNLIVHDSACPWGAVAAKELGVPAASTFTTFAFNRQAPSPTAGSWRLLLSPDYVRSRRRLGRGLPLVDLGNIRQPLNLVFTSRAFQIGAGECDESYRFVGPSIGARPAVASFPLTQLQDPLLYASLGTVFSAGPRLLRGFALALAPLAGTVVVATGQTDPAALGDLPANVLAHRRVPQPEILDRAALFVTHGGMNSVNEALYAGVPMLVVPQGADQPLVASRVESLGAGLTLGTGDVGALARRLLDEPGFAQAARTLRTAQREAGGAVRAADELEGYGAAR
ncbi:macrolide family glycosyltransferase [Paractinoplanes atraurantiacus]|uniref:Glycosyltransferase, MGT family n=1 Tax=Paractinoplanes atraurantiacus TaxID=1036182 RepID=A0A285I5C4_9ACTN|nr:macrolide family glycosyltransferase [Actinoplanes atraurantiacus]SNY42276.1 glycosyltransferase, MGT family [Actinoplanes atraurantiacus]